MPRFHFHTVDGEAWTDEEGVELSSAAEARAQAMQQAGEMLKDSAIDGPLHREWRMRVTDDHGLTLFHLDFHLTEGPAVDGAVGPEVIQT